MPYPAHLAQLLAMQKDSSDRPSGASRTVSPRTLPFYPDDEPYGGLKRGGNALPATILPDNGRQVRYGKPGAGPAPGQQIPGGNTLRRYGKIMPDDYDYDDAQSALLPENDDTPGAFQNRSNYRLETSFARSDREYRAELARINRKYRAWEMERADWEKDRAATANSRPLNTSPPISNEPLQPSPLVRNVPFQPSPAPMGVVDQRMPPKRAIPFDRMQMNRSY